MRNVRIRMLGLALCAMLAISATAVASASAALPELVNKEGTALVKKAYTSTSGKSTFETAKNGSVTCTADTDKGESTGVKTGVSTVTFTGCESIGIKCKTSGAKSGEIVTKAKSTVVYINKSTKEAGLLLASEEVTIECSVLQKLKVRGSVIGAITPVNTLVTPPSTFALTFSQSKGIQSPTEYENEKGEKVKAITETKGEGLKSFEWEQSGLATTDALLFEEAAEVKA